MNKLQTEILEMMKYIHKICDKNNITYFMIGGTMLGAVRHQGFIPWDDDIDIAMPREDFNRFIDIIGRDLPEWAEIREPGQVNCLNNGFLKFINKNTTLVEYENKIERIGGIFIDIFPLDGLGNEEKKAFRKLKRARVKFFLLKAGQDLSNIDNFAKKVLRLYAKVIGTKRLYNNLLKYLSNESFYSSIFVANAVGAWNLKEFMRREWFGKRVLYKFETEEFFGVQNPEQYLSSLYGQYMKLPPEEKRVSHHQVSYLNLNVAYKDYLSKMNK